MIPRAFKQRVEFASAVGKVEQELASLGARIRYTLGDDWSGEPAVLFWIVLPDDAAGSGRLLDVTKTVSEKIVRQVKPMEEWDVLPYFNYRSQSEQAQLKDPEWE